MSIEALVGIGLGVFLIAFAFAPVGMGGGMLFVPLLHYGAGWPIDARIIAASLTLTAVVSFGSGLAHRREGHVDDSIVKIGLMGAIPGALIGVAIVSLIGDHLDVVFKILSLFMILWAIRKTISKMNTDGINRAEEVEPDDSIVEIPQLRLGSAIGGLLSSVLAIGAGVIYVPILRTFGKLTPRKAIGTSLHFMMAVIPISILTHVLFLPTDSMDRLANDLPFIAGLAVLTFLGARSGAKFGMKHLTETRTMQIFLVLIVVVAVRYAIDIIGF